MSKSAELALAELFEAARAAQAKAYAPYSRFKVGAALRTPSGALYRGLQCRERRLSARASAPRRAPSRRWRAPGDRRIAEICVIGDGEGLCTPCGGCRQRIREFADGETMIHVAGPEGVRATFRFSELLPQAFGPGHLPS